MRKPAFVTTMLLGTLALAACGGNQTATGGPATSASAPATVVSVASVQRANIRQTVTFAGSVTALSQVDVQPRQSGRIETLAVKVGQSVQAGDIIAEIDHRQIDLALEQAQAQLQGAQAKLAAEKAGPTPETVAEAQLAVQTAQSKLQAVVNGPRPETVAADQAAVASAQAAGDAANQKLAALQHPRPETVAQAQANVVSAQQSLEALQHPRPETVAQAQLALDQAKQKLAAVQAGPRPEMVQQAQQTLVQAQATLQALRNGPSAANLQPLRIAVDQAKNTLFSAQVSRDAACGQVGKSTGPGQVGNQASCDAGNAQVNAAQSGVDAAVATLAKAQAPADATDLQKAQSAVDQAQAALNLAAHPYTAQDIQQAQDAVNIAQQQLALTQRPGSPQDIAKAQAALQQEQAALALAERPGSPQDIAQAADAVRQAQAGVTEAEQTLALAQRPYTAEDINQARIAVQDAQQRLAAAQKPYTAQDIQQAAAIVAQDQAAVDQAEQNDQDATVRAPVGGVVTAKDLSVGSLVNSGTTIVSIGSKDVQVDVAASEDQMTGIVLGKPATIAASGSNASPVAGTVTSIAPSADPKSRTFSITVTPTGQTAALQPGTFAAVTITPQEHQNVLAAPNTAVLHRNGKDEVFVVSGGVVKETPVSLGIAGAGQVELVSGVADGAQVVVQGQDALVNGQRVASAPVALIPAAS